MAIDFEYLRPLVIIAPFFDFRLKQPIASLPPTDEQSNGEAESQTTIPSDASSKRKWTPTPEAFAKLLICLSPDQNEAGERYEIIRLKLLRYFEHRMCDDPDSLVDEAFNRVMRRLDEGQEIPNLMAYFYSVAKLISMESWRERTKKSMITENMATTVSPVQWDDEDDDPRVRCFENCLEGLSPENRKLILDYYRSEKREKIDLRKQLATELNIPLNALRIRAHRIRKGLEDCVHACMGQYADVK